MGLTFPRFRRFFRRAGSPASRQARCLTPPRRQSFGRQTAGIIADAGRRSATNQVERLLAAGQRVVALDPFYFGEGKPKTHDYLWGLTLATIGDRPLGLQASQVAAVARWLRAEHPGEPLTLCAVGPRTSTVALVAAGLEEQAIARLDLQDPFPSSEGRSPAEPQIRGHARDVLLRPARSVRHAPTEGLGSPKARYWDDTARAQVVGQASRPRKDERGLDARRDRRDACPTTCSGSLRLR